MHDLDRGKHASQVTGSNVRFFPVEHPDAADATLEGWFAPENKVALLPQRLKPLGIPRVSLNGLNISVRTLRAASKSQQKASLVMPGSKFRDAYGRKSVCTVFGPSF